MTTEMHTFDFVRDATRAHVETVAEEKSTRAWDVQAVATASRNLSDRRFESAAELSRRALYESVAGVCNAALSNAIGVCYEVIGVTLINVDPVSWRVLFPLPWGSAGRRHYGLRTTEADVLRMILRGREDDTRQGHKRMFFYDPDSRRWCANLGDYGDLRGSNQYILRWPVSDWEVQTAWGKMMDRKRGHNGAQDSAQDNAHNA